MAISYDIDKKKWLCKCDCGKDYYARRDWLVEGRVISCGCYNKEKDTKDITNQRFGRLVALYPTKKRTSNRRIIWHCLCDCGNYVDVSSDSLKKGNTTSCGCIVSKGEELLKNIFNELNIKFIPQYTFEDCINPQTNAKLKFDFYLPEYNILIEYDGAQHYKVSGKWNDTKEKLQERQYRDELKNAFCYKKYLTLIRILYWDYNKLNNEYVLSLLTGQGGEVNEVTTAF